jgi:GT2 family glycosyltransferase
MPIPHPASLAVVVVLHDSADVIADCLRSLPRTGDVEVVVVDNASRDDGAARALAARSDATVLVSPVNRGFGGGCNLGWRATRRPVVAFVNPDVRVETDTLAVLLERLAREPHGMVGPALLDGDGHTRLCKARPSPLLDAVGMMPAAQRWAPPGWDGKLAADDPVHAHGGVVAALEGACFAIRREDLETIGGFDEDFFLYSEEEDLAVRLARLGGRPVYEPRARALHIGGTSTAKVSAFATRQRFRSRVVFYRKRDGELRGRLAALALALPAALSLVVAVLDTALARPTQTPPGHWLAVIAGLLDGARAPLQPSPMSAPQPAAAELPRIQIRPAGESSTSR